MGKNAELSQSVAKLVFDGGQSKSHDIHRHRSGSAIHGWNMLDSAQCQLGHDSPCHDSRFVARNSAGCRAGKYRFVNVFPCCVFCGHCQKVALGFCRNDFAGLRVEAISHFRLRRSVSKQQSGFLQICVNYLCFFHPLYWNNLFRLDAHKRGYPERARYRYVLWSKCAVDEFGRTQYFHGGICNIFVLSGSFSVALVCIRCLAAQRLCARDSMPIGIPRRIQSGRFYLPRNIFVGHQLWLQADVLDTRYSSIARLDKKYSTSYCSKLQRYLATYLYIAVEPDDH